MPAPHIKSIINNENILFNQLLHQTIINNRFWGSTDDIVNRSFSAVRSDTGIYGMLNSCAAYFRPRQIQLLFWHIGLYYIIVAFAFGTNICLANSSYKYMALEWLSIFVRAREESFILYST